MTEVLPLVERGNLEELRHLFERSARHDSNELNAGLIRAIQLGHVKMVQLLLRYGADLNHRIRLTGWSPLHTAIEHQHLKIVGVLVKAGADVNVRDNVGATPLHLAVDIEADSAHQQNRTPDASLIRVLLELGANRNLRDNSGRTPLEWGKEYAHKRAIELLEG